ncbi:hypothetical protein [Haloactinomyces albus]|uniref:Uncharacterized protein n=1 Tax=Haloactinomyces albus TaxID=1352928 RepID=A0AAE4CJM5_9ACTN|nr:hypothetical protein [Haloactinomyces albus]MDR7299844.1 hypothetical protein [Haloactinomyces albus]
MIETEQSQYGMIELLSMLVIVTGVPVAGESTALQIVWFIALAAATLLTWREFKQATPTPT